MKGMLKEGLMLTAGSAAMSAMPSNDISPHVTKGIASYASFYPARGAMAGMKIHMDLTKKIIRKTKRLK